MSEHHSPASPANADSPGALQLPQELTIYAVGELHPQWLAWLAEAASQGRDEAAVDAHAVDQVDAAGLQMLVSLQRSLADRGVRMRLTAPSDVLRQGCQALGLCDWLAAGTAHAETAEGTAA
jgi:anti-anti-sigma regulatory factor